MTEKICIANRNVLVVALTRSPVFMGVNIRLFFSNLLICTLICIDAQTWLGIPLCIVMHIIFVRLSVKDPNFLFVLYKAISKTPPVINKRFWGVNKYEPW